MNTDRSLKQATKEMAEKIGSSAMFLCIFNEDMAEEVDTLIQMGLAVYMDKPILLIMPECRLKYVPENLRRLARHIETFDDTLPEPLMKSSFEAATTRLFAHMTQIQTETQSPNVAPAGPQNPKTEPER